MKNLLRLSEPQNHRCCYRGHRMERHQHKDGTTLPFNAMTRDHVWARSRGGKNHNNLVAACHLCNFLRGDMDAEAFYWMLQNLFEQRPFLHRQWHSISSRTIRNLRRLVIIKQEIHLRAQAVQSIDAAFAHYQLICTYGHTLKVAA